MSDDYLWDRSGAPDPETARLEELLAPLGHDAPLDELRLRRPRRGRWIVLGVAVTAAAAAAIAFVVTRPHGPGACGGGATGFAFAGRGGTVTCAGIAVARGVLPVGGTLDTGAHEADLAIATIGNAELGPHTQVHLERSDAERHQLALDRGHLHARVDAPPRLFAVTTKSTQVTDLGCEYTIDVDGSGAGAIIVQHGKVELETGTGAVVVAPRGTHASILAGRRPGVPLGRGASATLVAAVHDYERDVPGGFEAVLAAAEVPDAITLVGLAAIDEPRRAIVLARLAEIAPPPGEITPELAARDAAALATWRDDIVTTFIALWVPNP